MVIYKRSPRYFPDLARSYFLLRQDGVNSCDTVDLKFFEGSLRCSFCWKDPISFSQCVLSSCCRELLTKYRFSNGKNRNGGCRPRSARQSNACHSQISGPLLNLPHPYLPEPEMKIWSARPQIRDHFSHAPLSNNLKLNLPTLHHHRQHFWIFPHSHRPVSVPFFPLSRHLLT